MRSGALALVLALCPAAIAATIHVPADQPTIQAALNAAQPGDEIVLAPNTYGIAAGLTFPQSGVALRGQTGDPHDVVLQGGGANTPINLLGRTGMVFSGLTFTDCKTAVRVTSGDAVFDRCRFFRNASNASPLGALVAVVSDITVLDCVFERNSCTVVGPGGAIAAYGGTLTVEDSLFTNNTMLRGTTQPAAFGGGVFSGVFVQTGQPAQVTTITLRRSEFRYGISDFGAAVATVGGTLDIDRCRFISNTATFGGAVFTQRFEQVGDPIPGSATITNSLFTNNRANRINGVNGLGGAIGSGGGALAQSVNNTFHANTAESQGGAWFSTSSLAQALLANNIFADNSAPTFVTQGPVNAASNLDGTAAAIGLADPIGPDGDPGSLDEDFRLVPSSPAIDAGDNSRLPPSATVDLAGLPRFMDDLNTPDTGVGGPPVVDIGAHEFEPTPPCKLADLAPLYGLLDLADVVAFVTAFTTQDPLADFDNNGLFDLADVVAFVSAFLDGCP